MDIIAQNLQYVLKNVGLKKCFVKMDFLSLGAKTRIDAYQGEEMATEICVLWNALISAAEDKGHALVM